MPITTRPLSRYFSYHAFTYGNARRQLMHEYVQKSTTTTWPRRPSAVSGGEFSHSVAPSSGGSLPITGRTPLEPRADIIAPPFIASLAPRIAPPPLIALLPDIAAPLPDGSSTSSSFADGGGVRSVISLPNSACSIRVVPGVETRDRKPVSSPNAIASAPTTTAPPSTRRIHSSAPSERFMAANTRPPSSSAAASDT